MIEAQSHRALRVLLLVFAILVALGSLVLIAGSSYLAAMAPAVLEAPPSMLYLVALKFIGVFGLAMSYLLYAASRDPVRYAAVIDAFIFLALAAAALDLYASFVLHVAPFTGWFVVVRSIIRVGIAVALIVLRPRP